MSNLKKPDYTEDTVALALQMYLSVSGFPWNNFSIELFSKNEDREKGADAVLNSKIQGFMPFYTVRGHRLSFSERGC